MKVPATTLKQIANAFLIMLCMIPSLSLAKVDGSGFTEVGVENGGVIILHTFYHPCEVGDCSYGKFVMVASDQEIESLREQFSSDTGLRLLVRVRDDGRQLDFDAQLSLMDDQTFTGQVIPSGEKFLLISEKIAREKGCI